MAITAYLFDNFPLYACKKLINDLGSAGTTIKVALCTSSYTPNVSTHTTFNDITNECPATGNYVAGGQALTTKTWTNSGHVCTFDAVDPAWTTSTIAEVRYVILYDATVAGATNEYLMGYWDLGQNYSTSSSTLTLVFSGSGILTFTVS